MAASRFTLREKIGQLFMVGFPGPFPDAAIRGFINDNNIGFVILFKRNVDSLEQVHNLTGELHGLGAVAPVIFTDQEGGTVVQFGEMAATVTSAMGLRATGKLRYARRAARIIGTEMVRLGIDGVLAPVLDVNLEPDNPIIGIRAFSDDPREVIRWGTAYFRGLRDAGALACGKHFPGHGLTREDSHLTAPEVEVSAETFRSCCLLPFARLCRHSIDAIMTGHVVYPHISSEIATFSPRIVAGILRSNWGYEGVVVSDCLEMAAVRDRFDADRIVRSAVEAGVDVLTVSHHLELQRELVDRLNCLVRTGKISEKRIDQSVSRILALKERVQAGKSPGGEENRPLAARPFLAGERKIVDRSITLVRHRRPVLPINRDSRVLFVEFPKVKAGQSLEESEDINWCSPLVNRYFPRADVRLLGFDAEGGGAPVRQLTAFDAVVAMIYSRSPEIARRHAPAIHRLLEKRDDLVVVSLGNPYDIQAFPSVSVYLASYGFRRIQMESLLRVIRGDIPPMGTLPVTLRGIGERGG